VTFRRVLQTGIEDRGYAQRIARLRGYYFDNAREVTPFLLSVGEKEQLAAQGLISWRWQAFTPLPA